MFKNKILMITGGTGSFGNTVLKRFLSTDVREIRIFSRDEKKQEEMRIALNNSKLKFYIGDVRDYEGTYQAMKGVDYVFHAAALKQVPSCEFYPMEAVRTNVIGTENVMNAATANSVKRVVVLSTDKAVYPINAMGISKAMAEKLLNDPKENAEHVMLVDLARNDLSRSCDEVTVRQYRQVHYYSHVIHLVSEVTGKVSVNQNPFELLAKTFPAGTLSGAPKFKAMELIDQYEPTPRGYYGGGIGFMGFDGSCNHAIMIRTFMSRNNTLTYQAGAGVVAASIPENELQEVNNKLNALKKAISIAEEI